MRNSAVNPPGLKARRTVARWLAAAAALLYSSFFLSYLIPTGRGVDFVSELELPGARFAGWYRASDVLAGVLLIGLVLLSRPRRAGRVPRVDGRRAIRWALIAAAAVGASSVLDGASSMDCNPSVQSGCDIETNTFSGLLRQLLVGHTLSGLVGFAAAGLGAACCARAAWLRLAAGAPAAGPSATALMRLHIVVAAAIGLCGLADVALLLVEGDVGLIERVRIVLVSVWIVLLPWTAQVCAPPFLGTSQRHACEDAARDPRRESVADGLVTQQGGRPGKEL